MRTTLAIVLLLISGLVMTARSATTGADMEAIRRAALDYIEGWYAGDAARMERSLHPELAKRIVRTTQGGESRLDSMSAMTLVQRVRTGIGTHVPKEKQQKDVTILDTYENVAIVKIVAAGWIDYLQMAKFNDEWKIVNVLWELKPQHAAAR
ncbi:MAG: nuclear transport factor 2 family protein [Steroidobacteraceae bacterium]